ncbi:hypothetical protein [Halobaculum sp. D14]|uniref:hypothetical protein n=1 Tax=Halobaculum sp. D14 TaxID=3421642 RepID=UPI003EBF8843
MSTTDRRAELDGSTLTDLPKFELRFLYDDGDQPRSVTVYDPESLETSWVTVDVDAAVSLDDVR